MKKLADFLVNRRYILAAAVILIAIGCAVLSMFTEINKDMTKYLSDNSNMKQGLDIMETAFSESGDVSSIRVMFDDLSETDIDIIGERLENIEYVSSVSYESDDENYNKENHTLFVVNSKYDYGTDEENFIEETIAREFSDYKMMYRSNDVQSSEVSALLLLSAVSMALVILFIMSESWLEPILFIAAIGAAILINLGTNIFFPYISDLTASIGPIIQLALSMDYSIILMNRYRQEKTACGDKTEAMKAALANSVSSIASSSLTTVVGLLALVFLSFKLGPELGIVLAKGVFISMLCVFTLLPVLILLCDKGIEKSRKKSPRIPMGILAKFSHKARFAMPVIFAGIFIAFYIIQGGTEITFTEGIADPMADIFPKDNTAVIVYDNGDEDSVNEMISEIEKDEGVKSVVGFANTLGKEMNAADMGEAIRGLSDDADIDDDIVRMLYYVYYSDGNLPEITAEEFINFIKEYVIENDMISEYMDEGLTENMDYIEKFSDRNILTSPMNFSKMSEFFDIADGDMKQLYLYYFTENGGVPTGEMTAAEFADFAVNTLAENEAYSDMLDEDALSQLETLQTYTDKELVTSAVNYEKAAEMLGMDVQTVKMLYVYYFSQNGNYSIGTMTLSELVSFMRNDVLGNPVFAAYMDENAAAGIEQLAALADRNTLTAPLPPEQLAPLIGTDIQTLQGIMQLSGNTSGTMSLSETVSIMLSNENITAAMPQEQIVQLETMQNIIQLVISDTALNFGQAAGLMGIDETSARLLFTYHDSLSEKFADCVLSTETIVNFLSENSGLIDSSQIGEILTAKNLINAAVTEKQLSSEELAELIGMDKAQTESMYLLYLSENGGLSDRKISPQQFVTFAAENVLQNETFSDYFDEEAANSLKTGKTLIDAVVQGKKYNLAEMTSMLSGITDEITENDTEVLYIYYAGVYNSASDQKMTIPQLFDYLCDELVNDERFAGFFDDKTKKDLAESKSDLNEAMNQMRGSEYSRLIVTSDYSDESHETLEFMKKLDELRNTHLKNPSYLVGTSAMVYEMNNSFRNEYTVITIITAVSIFVVVLLAFRKPIVPAMLTLLVQCGVYITVAVIGLFGGSMYYLALLIVQSILMGATIDYGIVFSNYYLESRRTDDRQTALKTAYDSSIHTIMTSGSILVIVLAVLGIFSESITSQVCKTLSIGALVAVMLILLVLPALLAFFDKATVKR
ncbi:MAG: MMPL family transporter [Eubacterium sp.]|nr:MMPL family transporter [Eubacterium sp.]